MWRVLLTELYAALRLLHHLFLLIVAKNNKNGEFFPLAILPNNLVQTNRQTARQASPTANISFLEKR